MHEGADAVCVGGISVGGIGAFYGTVIFSVFSRVSLKKAEREEFDNARRFWRPPRSQLWAAGNGG